MWELGTLRSWAALRCVSEWIAAVNYLVLLSEELVNTLRSIPLRLKIEY